MDNLGVQTILAVAAGFLLNLTPCVLPAIPLKVSAILRKTGSAKRERSLAVFAFPTEASLPWEPFRDTSLSEIRARETRLAAFRVDRTESDPEMERLLSAFGGAGLPFAVVLSRSKPPAPKNRFATESSPYLLQHAGNPVDWFPWGEEAFEKARSGNKPIFLSIGYSTCYWCHVMERESFENPEVAERMNRTVIAVKVDREERPDLDGIYMKAVTLMTEVPEPPGQ